MEITFSFFFSLDELISCKYSNTIRVIAYNIIWKNFALAKQLPSLNQKVANFQLFSFTTDIDAV